MCGVLARKGGTFGDDCLFYSFDVISCYNKMINANLYISLICLIVITFLLSALHVWLTSRLKRSGGTTLPAPTQLEHDQTCEHSYEEFIRLAESRLAQNI